MKVVHLPGSVSRRGGGVFNVALHHVTLLQQFKDVDVQVVGLLDDATQLDSVLWGDTPLHLLRRRLPAIHWIPRLGSTIANLGADILHSHMVWTSQSRALLRQQKPYVVSPHGMLDPYLISRSKKLALGIFEKKSLSKAACLHALNQFEYETLRNLGLKNPIAIIPNGLFPKEIKTEPKQKHKKRLLFLSRIAHKKGIEPLLEAWSLVGSEDWQLDIYGWGENKYVNFIKGKIDHLKLSNVKFLGEVHGIEKERVFAQSDAFILPSFSEGFPMVVLEAWQAKLPVLMTDGCNMKDAFNENAALRIRQSIPEMAEDINKFLAMDIEQSRQYGLVGNSLLNEKYNWNNIGYQLHKLYTWILKGGTKPDFVMLN